MLHSGILYISGIMYLIALTVAALLQGVLAAGNTTSNGTSLVDADVYPGASQECLIALGSTPNCNPLVYALYGSYYMSINLETLTDLCRDSCFTSLLEHKLNVTTACDGIQYYDEASGAYYPPDLLDLQAMSAFNVTCVQNSYVSVLR